MMNGLKILNMKKFKLNVSITDFAPLFGNLEYLFKGLKETGVDGLEIVLGIKSRWSENYLLNLSKKYNLEINTFHQSMWSGGGLYLDEGMFRLAKKINVKGITIHPLVFRSLNSNATEKYFKKLSLWQKKYGIKLFLENMPSRFGGAFEFLNNFYTFTKDVGDLGEIYKKAQEYGFLITFDSTHFDNYKPHENKEFKEIFSKIGNIHLSSFEGKIEHLPLNKGKFDSKGFFNYLDKNNYKGIITFEIYYPSVISLGYDFKPIKESVEVVRKLGY